jgi:polyisoprenoid-binding protein YceI
MYKIIIVAMMLLSSAYATTLTLSKGEIKAHTEVFGDSTINPTTTKISSSLSRGDTLTDISGTISIPAMSLKSDNDGRDEHMQEALHATTQKLINVKINKVQKIDDEYEIYADLTLNGVTKQIVSMCNIKEESNKLNMDGNFSINMTDYNIEQPKMFFLTVRNRVDITYNLDYSK